MSTTAAELAGQLFPAINELHQQALDRVQQHTDALESIHANHQSSAHNLLHFLAVRHQLSHSLRQGLSLLGLANLTDAASHVMSQMETTLRLLTLLSQPDKASPWLPIDNDNGVNQLKNHCDALFGPRDDAQAGRIMVTVPAEAARNAEFMAQLLRAGMNVMRINCAQDDSVTWLDMIHTLRKAEQDTGLRCRILADLAGPQLCTGEIEAIGQLVELKVKRDALGRILQPARIWIVPRTGGVPNEAANDTVLPVDTELAARIHAGDHLEVEDSRGGRRLLTVKERFGDAWLAQCFQHAYIANAAACTLYRDDDRVGTGTVGPLPDVVQPILLKPGDSLLLTRDSTPGTPASHNEQGRLIKPATIPCTLPEMFETVAAGQTIWFDDGKLGGRVLDTTGDRIEVGITHAAQSGSKLRAGKGINLPDTTLRMPALTEQDCADLAALAAHIDMIGLSFVRRREDVLNLLDRLGELSAHPLAVVLKIETRQGFENLSEILLAAMRHPVVGVMLVREDLAVEVGFERLTEVQAEILQLCEAAHMPVIWATQVLDSMIKRGLPSRTEITDAANSCLAACVMLNKGPYIIEATRFMGGLCERLSGQRARSPLVTQQLALP